jgi:2,4-dienoyl-CoA reductase-like NADH-dependent reductase (Old Yellow Enzyme family)
MYKQRSASAGLILTEGTFIEPLGAGTSLVFLCSINILMHHSFHIHLHYAAFLSNFSAEWSNAPGIFSKNQIEGWKKVTSAVHSEGSYMFCQLWHIGRVAHPFLQAGQPNVGPSAIAANGGKFRQLAG